MVRYRTGIFVIKTFFVAIYEKSNGNNRYWIDVFVLRYGTGTTYVRTSGIVSMIIGFFF